MPVETRAKVPLNRIYSSPAPQQQVRFRPKKRNITYRRSLGASHRARQQTLTQIDFVELQEAFDQDNDESYINCEDEEQSKKRKRRRTDGVPSSSSNFHTQTLTQLEFVSTPASRFEQSDDVENNLNDTSSDVEQELDASHLHKMGPPKTPSRRRVYEVPSSQSPFSPVSDRSQRFSTTRSPLKILAANIQAHSLSPVQKKEKTVSPVLKLETEDTFKYENESQQSRILQTPDYMSSPTKGANSSAHLPLSTGIQKYFKDEIQDSDEEDDDYLESDYDSQDRESPINQHYKHEPSSQFVELEASNPSPSDTQEAKKQLEKTILQFTQQVPLITAAAEEEQISTQFVRPSQATTVSQSQPALSSPVFLRRPSENLPLKDEAFPRDEGTDPEQEQIEIEKWEEEEELPVLAIPDSPSQQLTSDPSWLTSSLRRLRSNRPSGLPPTAERHQQSQKRDAINVSYTSSSVPIKAIRPQSIIPSSATENPNSDSNPNTSLPAPPFSLLPSSQLLTRSQMLPDSLMNASVPPPPSLPFLIEDSESESGFED